MERRLRPRGCPEKKAMAFLSGIPWPIKVLDYCATGMAVPVNGEWRRVLPGNKLNVDIVVDEKLLACGIPGKVCWNEGNRAGIQFNCSNDMQKKAAYDIEVAIKQL